MSLKQAFLYESPTEIPASVGLLPAAWLHYGEDLVRLAREYPDMIPNVPNLETLRENLGINVQLGGYTDEWGIVWSNVDEGVAAIATGHPLPNREDIHNLKIPDNREGRFPHGFMYLRLLDLRGFEEAMIDFVEEPPELQLLIDKVLEYNCIQLPIRLAREGEMPWIGDDLGMQTGLAIGAEKWRKYLKPCYKKLFDIMRAHGKYVYFHTDGCIWEIMPDLLEIGTHIINPQVRANGLDNLARVCKGKIPIDLDLDRQLFPFATPSELDDHVRECVETMWLPQGGLGLKIELNYEVPLQNMAAIFDGVRKYKGYRG